MKTESANYLQAAYEAIAQKLGATPEEAGIFGQCYIRADVTGRDTQGIAEFPYVVRLIKQGIISFGKPVTTVEEGPGYALLDGHHGPGQVVTAKAMELAIRKARETAIGSVWVKNGNDTGMVSNYSEMALQQDFIGLAMNNTGPLVSAWGGRDPILGTNPISFAIPAGQEQPIVFDGGSGSITAGAVVHAARNGTIFPGDYLVDEAGKMTNNPVGLVRDPYERKLSLRGAIAPQGARGFGLLIWVEIVAGLLSGGTISARSPREPGPQRHPTAGIFVQAIDVGKLVPIDQFKARVDEFIHTVKTSRLAQGFREILLPGERAQREEARRRVEGVPVPDHYWEKFAVLASEVGVDLNSLRASFY
jgi:LDH2 family malate/lactate/ureidoglycolate dehydrogenase